MFISSYQNISTSAGNIQIKTDLYDKLNSVDSIIFDYDGVLVDVAESIMQVHNRTADLYFSRYGWIKTDCMVTYEDVELFKLAGGFNNDWELACAWAMFYWAKHETTKSIDGEYLRLSYPPFIDFIIDIAEAGGGISSMEKVIGTICTDVELGIIQSKYNKDKLIHLFKQIYAGKHSFEMYGIKSDMPFDGFITADKPILNTKLMPKNLQFGIATGRTAGEASVGIKLMGWEEYFPNRYVVTEDDGYLKPDPNILKLAVDRMGVCNPVYIGDTPDDLLTATKYSESNNKMISCMVKTGLKNPDIESIFVNQNADIIADNVNAALLLFAI